MDEPFYHVNVPTREALTADDVRRTLERGLAAGWTTTREGDVDRCPFTDPENDRYGEWTDTERAIEALATRQHGSITFFVEDGAYDFDVGVRPDWSAFDLPDLGGVTISWHRSQFREDPATVADLVFDVAALVYRSLPAAFAFSYLPLEVERETPVRPRDVEAGRLPDVYWLSILPPSQVEAIGRERLRSVPAWRSEPVGDDAWGVLVAADPYAYRPAEKDSVRDHLDLGGGDRTPRH